MADDRKITIEILGPGTGETKRTTTGKGESKEFQDNLSKYLHPVKTLEKAIFDDHVIAKQAAVSALLVAKGAVEPSISRYLNLKEDYLAENEFNQIKSNISKTTGFAASLAGGAIIGAKAGPIGAVVGAAISGLTYGVKQIINYQQKMSGFYQQLNATNMQTAFMSQKAGLIVGTQNTLG